MMEQPKEGSNSIRNGQLLDPVEVGCDLVLVTTAATINSLVGSSEGESIIIGLIPVQFVYYEGILGHVGVDYNI